MELEKISKGFVYAVIVYLVILLYGMNFILSNISYGGLTADFWLITLILMLPLILLVIYAMKNRFGFLYGHETLLKRLIIIFIVIAAVFAVFFIIPFTY